MSRRTLLFFVAEDWYFLSHRLPLALAAQNAGYRVYLITNINKDGERIKRHGIELIPIKLKRRGKNPFTELAIILRLTAIYRRTKPDIVHHVALKPVLYGSLAALLSRAPVIVNALAGLGYVYASKQRLARILRPFIKSALKQLVNCRRCSLIVQNPDDRDQLISDNIIDARKIALIRGSGIDPVQFYESPEPDGIPVVTLPARMLWDKGVGEFIGAARILKHRGIQAQFKLAGDTDPHNPTAIPRQTLEQWKIEGVVEWLGPQSDMSALYRESHIICLPSYREGLPKSLLEAAASARPIVTTDVPGCREIVIPGENGLRVPPREPVPLADALEKLIQDPELRQRMGRASRKLALSAFTTDHVVRSTLSLYDRALPI